MTKFTRKIRFTLTTRYIELSLEEEEFQKAFSELKNESPFLYMNNMDGKLWIINKSKIELVEEVTL